MENAAAEDNTLPPLPDSGTTDRAALRRQWLDWRAALPATVYADWSAALVQRLADWLTTQGLPGGKKVAFCWPVQNEPDVLPLIRRWQGEGQTVLLPEVVAPDGPLQFREWVAGGELQPDRYGIPTPTAGRLMQPDLLLLPGNAFDIRGFRLGYGGGFFDRTLAVLSPRPIVVGLGFSASVLPDLHPQAHDMPVDVLVTEKSIIFAA